MKELESEIKQFLTERGWDKLRPSDIAKSISIEAAELLEVFQWSSVSVDKTRQDAGKMEKIKEELADVFIYAIEMAILLDLDVGEIIRVKLEQVKKKYPAKLMKKNSKGSPNSGEDPDYWKIKYAVRRAEDVQQE
jgi:NTP pyrophosphatase (non-canonical NTP hydrolase)